MDVLQASFLLNNVSFSLKFSIILYSNKNEERKKKQKEDVNCLQERGGMTKGLQEEERKNRGYS